MPTVNNPVVTLSDVRSLRDEAGVAGDTDLRDVCDLALAGDEDCFLIATLLVISHRATVTAAELEEQD